MKTTAWIFVKILPESRPRLDLGPDFQKILEQTYEKLRIRSDLGKSSEKLRMNLHKTYDQRNKKNTIPEK